MTADYQIDRNREEARHRLKMKEKIQDSTTIRALRGIGVCEGWTCLEVGAGGGSIAAWLCGEVGSTGEVVATDIDTTFLQDLDSPNLVVLEHNVITDDLRTAAFDLVYARDVLVHISEREAVLQKMANAVKPGGWILIQEPDASSVQPDPMAPETVRQLYSKVMEAIYSFLCERGLDPYYGSRLLGSLRVLGFESLHSEAWCRTYQGGGTDIKSPHIMAFREVMEPAVSAGAVSAKDFQDFLALFEDPVFSWREDLTVLTWGRRKM
ncbi:MAG: methyltransferase domain-containing protein [Planctomycetota bacterium]|jgi:SAM-dependent methyltransferase